MKNRKFILLMITAAIIISQIFVFSANAENSNETASKIPGLMAPNTIIEYTCPNDYTIIQGGEAVSAFSDEEDTTDNFELLCEKAGVELNRDDFVKMEMPEPNAGTKVYYDADGRVKEIQVANTTRAANTCPNCGDPYKPVGSKPNMGPGVSWGESGNFIYNDGYCVHGTGRFTNFTDEIGSGGDKLKKGDVATRYHVDNPPNGTRIQCAANGYTVMMTKRDVGCLKDAVLDIWKDGVEYFGKSWNENLSINGGYYCYQYKPY